MTFTQRIGVIPVTYQIGWTLDGPLLVTHYLPIERITNLYKR